MAAGPRTSFPWKWHAFGKLLKAEIKPPFKECLAVKIVLFTLLLISSSAFAGDTMLSVDEFNEVIVASMSQHFINANESLKSISYEKKDGENDIFLVEGFDKFGNCYSKSASVYASATRGISVKFSPSRAPCQ
jgi:hypothetical protein